VVEGGLDPNPRGDGELRVGNGKFSSMPAKDLAKYIENLKRLEMLKKTNLWSLG
jgi:hypothetical protein